MINNNKFFIKNLSSIVFIGETPIFDKLIKFNDSMNIKSIVITSSNQSKSIKKNIDYIIHDKLDENFKNYLSKEVDQKDKRKKYYNCNNLKLVINEWFQRNKIIFNS